MQAALVHVQSSALLHVTGLFSGAGLHKARKRSARLTRLLAGMMGRFRAIEDRCLEAMADYLQHRRSQSVCSVQTEARCRRSGRGRAESHPEWQGVCRRWNLCGKKNGSTERKRGHRGRSCRM